MYLILCSPPHTRAGCDDNVAAADSRSTPQEGNRESESTRRRMNETKSGGDSNDSPSPSTRRRTHFSARQLSVLDGRFCQCPYVSYFERLQLGRDLGITERQVKVWFQNRRTKERRKTAAKGNGRSEAGDRPERFVQSQNADDNESAS